MAGIASRNTLDLYKKPIQGRQAPPEKSEKARCAGLCVCGTYIYAPPIAFSGGLFIFRHKPTEKVRKSYSKQSASSLCFVGQEKTALILS